MVETPSTTDSPELTSPATKSISIIFKGVIALLLLSQLYTFGLFAYSLLLYPYDWATSESDHIYYASRILEGETLYKDSDTFPLLGIGYPPGYHILLAVPVKLLGNSLLPGRVLALLLCGFLAFLLYKITKRESESVFLGLVASLSLLAYGPVAMWFATVRMETLYVALVLAGMYLVSRHQEGRARIFLASLCFAYSFFTKQVGLFGLGAACLFLLVDREYRKCAILIAMFALITIPVYLIFNRLTDGWYLTHLFGVHMHREFSWARGGFLLGLIQTSPVFCALACYGILHELKDWRLSPWTCYLLGALPVALLIFFDGTGTNYFLPFYSALLISACIGAGRIMSNAGSGAFGGGKIWISLLIIFQLLTFSASKFYLRGPSEDDRKNLDILAEQIRRSDEPVLVDRMGSLILGTEHEEYFVEPVLLMYLYFSGEWSPDTIIAAVEEEKFSLICLFDRTQFVPPVVEAIRDHYRPISSIPIRTIEPGIDRNLIIYARKHR